MFMNMKAFNKMANDPNMKKALDAAVDAAQKGQDPFAAIAAHQAKAEDAIRTYQEENIVAEQEFLKELEQLHKDGGIEIVQPPVKNKRKK